MIGTGMPRHETFFSITVEVSYILWILSYVSSITRVGWMALIPFASLIRVETGVGHLPSRSERVK